uniref:amidohydrolase n=1 Tax=Enterocloster hominis (ex Hitch et al. 2024) TaxID=1917870 RepID=UPI00102FE19F|nr:amidohydrolase [Lachnoclostridium pacaense]
MERKILIKNAKAIVTCDSRDQVYWDSDILIEGPEILKIGKDIEADGAETIRGDGKFVYPGLINTHHHFFQTFVRNLTSIDYPNLMVMDWIDKIYRIFQIIDSDVIYYSSLTALGDLIKHGCTCAFDHQYCYTNKTGKTPVDRQMEAAGLLGIRYHAGRGTNTLSRADGSSIPDNMLETTDGFLKDCERLIDLYHDPGAFSMRQIVMAPCQPINCTRDTFKETVSMARDKGVRMHTHLGEGENEGMVARWGKRTMDWCAELGFIGEDVWYAHDWEVTPEEYRVLASTKTGVSHCPSPAILGGFPILDIKEMLKAGINISLGCDGSATNDSSNLLDALRIAYLMQTYHSKQRGGCVSAYEMLKVATINGAKTLGRPDLGSLEPGKAADLFMIDTAVLELTGALHDPKNIIARVGLTGPVWLTMINGDVVYRDSALTGVDEERLAAEGEALCSRVIREPSAAFKNLV